MSSKLSAFVSKNEYEARVLVKCCPPNYTSPTLLLRCIDKEGEQTVFQLTGEAKIACDGVEQDRIYVFKVPGRCVRAYEQESKSGVSARYGVHTSFHLDVVLSKNSWPSQLHYKTKSFIELGQLNEGAWVDVIGIVSSQKVVSSGKGASLVKKQLVVHSGHMEVMIELLGAEKTRIATPEGQVIAASGLQIKEYNNQRYLASGFLTYIEMNPAPNPTLALPDKVEPGPKKKALKATELTPLPLLAAKDLGNTMLEPSDMQGSEEQSFATFAKVRPFTEELFRGTSILYGDDSSPKVKLTAELFDDRCSLPTVTIWHDAVQSIMETDATTIVGLWQECDKDDGKETLLGFLNGKLGGTFRLECKAKLWAYGNDKKMVQYHVNAASLKDDEA